MLRRRYFALVAVLAMMLFPLAAWGSVVYTVVDDTYTSGSMGKVPVSASGLPGTPVRNVVTNLGGDHQVYGFRNEANELRVLLAQYTRGQPDTVWIYDARGEYRTPLKEVRWSSFSNSRGVAALWRYLYTVDYDNAKVARIDTRGDAYSEVDSFAYSGTPGYDFRGEGIVRVGDHLYALFNEVRGDWTDPEYNEGRVVKLDAELNVIGTANTGRNALSIKAHDGMIYVVANGGPQKGGDFNPGSAIQRIHPNTLNVETLFRAGGGASASALPPGWRYDFRDIAFAGNDVYIFAGVYDENWAEFDSRIFKTNLQGLAAGNIGEEYRDTTGPGFAWRIEYDNVDDILWCAAGNRLTAYKGAESREFDAAALGGNFYSFVVVDAPVNPAPADSSGGCDSGGFPAIFLLAVIPLLFIAGKKGRA